MRIELQNVSVERRGRRILDRVDAVFAPGQMTVVLGRSGAGLSTLLKTAAGLVQPTGGQVLYDGQALANLDHRRRQALQTRTGFMFQDAALWANSSLLVNLDLPLQAKFPGLGPAERRVRIDTALNSCGFAADLRLRPAMLSHGQQTMVSFLRAIAPGPEALFLDEPMAAMDQRWRGILIRVLGELRAQGAAVVAVSHDAELARVLADRLVILADGRVLADGAPEAVRESSDPAVREILHDRFAAADPAGE
ncbi:MAG: ATP-binding cassette domain-containing protein [Candidatus Krumholzibacteriia bacterium]